MSKPSAKSPGIKGAPGARPATVQFVALSELARHRLTVRDLLPLVPATLISLVFNTLFVLTLLWFNAPTGKTNQTAKLTIGEEETKYQDVEQEKDFIDPDADMLIDDTMPSMEVEVTMPGEDFDPKAFAGIVEPPDENAVSGIGSGDEGGVQGLNQAGIPGIEGSFLEDAKYGFKGDQGFGPMGDGFGLPGATGGGSLQGGGFGYRTGNLLQIAKAQGGNDASEAAVGRGLKWLALHQSPDGRWSLDKYNIHNPRCRCRDPNVEGSVRKNDTAGTALGLLPFLGAGHTHKKGKFPRVVLKGLQFLMSKQGRNGDLGGGMYSHALGTIALCEAYAMTSDLRLRGAAQAAIRFIEYAQNTQTGGWRYAPRTDGDTSVVGWQVMALRSGQMAGLHVRSQTLELAKRWLDSCQKEGGAKYSYVPGNGATPTMTAAGLLNRQYLGWGPRNPSLHKGAKYLLRNLPPAKPGKNARLGRIYYYYYASQVLHHLGGEYWKTWNPLMRDFLIATQEKEGHKMGSWNPLGADYGGVGGRIYATSLSILTLEVYYRYLPLYRREGMARNEMAAEMKDEKK